MSDWFTTGCVCTRLCICQGGEKHQITLQLVLILHTLLQLAQVLILQNGNNKPLQIQQKLSVRNSDESRETCTLD